MFVVNLASKLWLHVQHWMPSYLMPFLSLSYPTQAPLNPDSFKTSFYYGTGQMDLCLVVTIIAVMAVLRDAFRLWLFEPFAQWFLTRELERRRRRKVETKVNGSTKTISNGHGDSNDNSNQKELRRVHRSVLRFAEQGWSFVYYTTQSAFGLYVNYYLPSRLFDGTSFWSGYPHTPLPGLVKFYYLSQFSFYLHQILILHAEARRKDHYQMLAHHLIAIVLMGSSYHMNFTRVGCLIMVLMDWCDIFLPLAKMIRYLQISQLACDLTFGIFLVSWLITRHVLFLFVIKAVYDAPKFLDYNWNPKAGSYLNTSVHWCFNILLMSLQVIQLFWFWMICRVAWRVVSGRGAADERSDDESDDKAE
ncbi:hypothetical protein APHAL10511_001813 [Amanita phalloides]|nr:hypothetical protein APHAL10511_001813 [Amanita phalloides]